LGWNRSRYYTRSRRVDGRTVREYVGAGEKAARAAAEDRSERQRHADDTSAQAAEQAHELAQEAPLIEFDILCTAVMRATLEEAGFHQHQRGEWRRRRRG
jgi:hypothetical protein